MALSTTSILAICLLRRFLRLWEVFMIWVQVFKNGPSKICGRQRLKSLKGYSLLKQTISLQIFLRAVFHKFYLVHSWILWLISKSILATFNLCVRIRGYEMLLFRRTLRTYWMNNPWKVLQNSKEDTTLKLQR